MTEPSRDRQGVGSRGKASRELQFARPTNVPGAAPSPNYDRSSVMDLLSDSSLLAIE